MLDLLSKPAHTADQKENVKFENSNISEPSHLDQDMIKDDKIKDDTFLKYPSSLAGHKEAEVSMD